jgi:hypothetical protein
MIGILTVSLLAGGTDAIITSLSTASAHVSTLGEPLLVKKERLQVRKKLAPTKHNSPFLPMEH